MILQIDTTNREKICLGLYEKDEKSAEKCFEFETKDQSADLLIAIDNILKREKKIPQDLKAILINQGPGSYTGVRVGVTVANTLAWALNIPILGYRKENKEKILAKISKSKISKFSKIVLPYYLS